MTEANQRVPLPNANWIRSEKMPEYAINLDPESRFFGWKMREHAGSQWVSVLPMRIADVCKCFKYAAFANHHDRLADLLEKLT